MHSSFWFKNPQKTYILSPRVGHLCQCKSPRVGILLHYLDPMVGHLQHFFAKMTNARQTPGGGGGWAPMELIETYYTGLLFIPG